MLHGASCESKITEREPAEICRAAGIPLLLARSIKAGLDIDWSDPQQKAMAIEVVERQVSSLHKWVECHLDNVIEKSHFASTSMPSHRSETRTWKLPRAEPFASGKA